MAQAASAFAPGRFRQRENSAALATSPGTGPISKTLKQCATKDIRSTNPHGSAREFITRGIRQRAPAIAMPKPNATTGKTNQPTRRLENASPNAAGSTRRTIAQTKRQEIDSPASPFRATFRFFFGGDIGEGAYLIEPPSQAGIDPSAFPARHNANAVKSQVWISLLFYVLLRYLHRVHAWAHRFSRLFMDLRNGLRRYWDLASLLNCYGTARGHQRMLGPPEQAFFPGFSQSACGPANATN